MGTATIETKNSTSSVWLLRPLLLEQNATEAEKILSELKDSGLEITPCIAGEALEFKQALQSGKFDVIISALRNSSGRIWRSWMC
jgi:hypothetical protein